ncbi:MAG: hypothetical protein WA322_00800 [Pseudolabrys sp.]
MRAFSATDGGRAGPKAAVGTGGLPASAPGAGGGVIAGDTVLVRPLGSVIVTVLVLVITTVL